MINLKIPSALTVIYVCCSVVFAQFQAKFPSCIEDNGQGREKIIDCIVRSGQYVDYRKLREYTGDIANINNKYNVSIQCQGGQIYLPAPITASNIESLTVNGCGVDGYFSELFQKVVYPDELKYLSVTDSTFKVSVKDLLSTLTQVDKISAAVDCVPLNAYSNIFKNIQYEFSAPENDAEQMMLMDHLMNPNARKNLVSRSHACMFRNLEYMEHSGSRSISSIHFKILESSEYPELKTYKFMNNSITEIPKELKDLKLSFLPKLTKLDLSANHITNIDFVHSGSSSPFRLLYVNMQYNNIHNLTIQTLQELSKSNGAVLDLRNNPEMRCSCTLFFYRKYLERLSVHDNNILTYSNIPCTSVNNGVNTFHKTTDINFQNLFCPMSTATNTRYFRNF